MSRTSAGFVSLLLAAVTVLSPGEAVAGPPEAAKGKMVLDTGIVRTPAGVLTIRQAPGGMTVEGAGIRGTAKLIRWDKKAGLLRLEGSEDSEAELLQGVPGHETMTRDRTLEFEPRTQKVWVVISLEPERVRGGVGQ